MTPAASLLVLALVIGLNIISSVRVWRVYVFTAQQRVWQIAIIWALPILGAIVILVALRAIQAVPNRDGYASIGEERTMPGMGPEPDHSYGDSHGDGHS